LINLQHGEAEQIANGQAIRPYQRNNKDFVNEIDVFQNSCFEYGFLRRILRLKGTLTYTGEERMIMNSNDARKELMQ
jgi:hypothetical protein